MARLADSLRQFRNEVDARSPSRSKASDGWIGDAAHGTKTDHYPNAFGVVCALDLTDDPANGVDIDALFDFLVVNPPPAAKFFIAKRRIASRKSGFAVRPYHGGTDPSHDHHLHTSVGEGPEGQSTGPYDDTSPWLAHFDTPGDDVTQAQMDTLIKEIRDNAIAVASDVKSTKTDVTTVAKKLDQVNERLDAIEAKLK